MQRRFELFARSRVVPLRTTLFFRVHARYGSCSVSEALKGGGPPFRAHARQEARGAGFPSAAGASHAAPVAERDSRADASGLYAETQKTLKFTKDMHGVRFDAYIKSENLWAEIGRRVPRAKALHS